MKKLLISIVLIFIFSALGFACTMPELHGLKPGMTKKEVQKLLDKKFLFLTKAAEFPNMPEVKSMKTDKVAGTKSVHLIFYNEVVYSVLAIYDETVKSRSLVEFAESSSKSFQLSENKLNYMDSKFKPASKEAARYAALYCDNFQFFVTGTPTFALGVMNLETYRAIDNISRLRVENSLRWENRPKPY